MRDVDEIMSSDWNVNSIIHLVILALHSWVIQADSAMVPSQVSAHLPGIGDRTIGCWRRASHVM